MKTEIICEHNPVSSLFERCNLQPESEAGLCDVMVLNSCFNEDIWDFVELSDISKRSAYTESRKQLRTWLTKKISRMSGNYGKQSQNLRKLQKGLNKLFSLPEAEAYIWKYKPVLRFELDNDPFSGQFSDLYPTEQEANSITSL